MNYLLKIDTAKIDQARLFKGAKGTYLDCVMVESRESKYGDSHMIQQSVSKEERLAGKKGPILGNAKPMGGGKRTEPAPASQTPPAQAEAKRTETDDGQVPF
jgi:hypothetical protein